jgi:hypothetical protein
MPVRSLILHPDFIHRINDDDTVDSICLYCFGTVASLPKEMDLEQKEYAHACSQKMQHMSNTKPGLEGRNPVMYARQSTAQ